MSAESSANNLSNILNLNNKTNQLDTASASHQPGYPKKIGSLLENHPALVLVKAWKETAGPALLKHTEFLGVSLDKGGIRQLKIGVFDSVWHQELQFQHEEILKRFIATLRRFNYPEELFPKSCSLTRTTSMPLKALYSQKRGDVKRIKR
jgi:hypothetical protein